MKQFKTSAGTAAVAIALMLGPAPASAADGLGGQAASALGRYIASQGNAALVQIREDLRRDFLRTADVLAAAPKPVPVTRKDRSTLDPQSN